MNNSNKIRVQRYESRMKECLNDFIYYDSYDEKIKSATITYTKLSSDMSILKVYIDCLNREKVDRLVDYLNQRKGVFRTQLANNFDLRRIPEIIFKKDETIDRHNEIEDILSELNLNKNTGGADE